MEILRPRVGDIVRVRQHTWTVRIVDNYEHCRVLSLHRVGERTGHRCQVIEPFDDVRRTTASDRPRRVSLREWRRACRALILDDGGATALRTAATARVDLLPYQLEPALAVLQGLGARVLLADDVGLGKTVQAMLACAELMARGIAKRVLVICPAGLRAQWAEECSARFGVSLSIFDQRSIARLRSALPLGTNPWATQATVVTSIDFVKRPEVLPLVRAAGWDALIIDEAHGASGDSDRRDAVQQLSEQTPYVFLLTATPHNGDEAAFSTLCRFGQHGDRLVVFRRSRTEVGGDLGRRVHTVAISSSSSERRMHAALDALTRAVRREWSAMDRHAWLMLTLFHKRALSCPFALAVSVERRLAMLDETSGAGSEQLWLPLDDPSGELDDSDTAPMWSTPALRDISQERHLLERLALAARAAEREASKLGRLRRLLGRLREPAIVFTEYRDTLIHLHAHVAPHAAVVHGGMPADERQAALRSFASAGLLLATDAAGEGLNLQHACRTVINLELPWNPMRLEQRIGRVDRIGQKRRVHVFHLVSRDTGETRLLDRLSTRISRAQARVGASDPMCGRPAWTEEASARLVVLNEAEEASQAEGPVSASVPLTRLVDEASSEADRIRLLRTVVDGGPRRAGRSQPRQQAPLFAFTRHAGSRARLGNRSLAVFQSVVHDALGRRIASLTEGVLWRDPRPRHTAHWPLMQADEERLRACVDHDARHAWVARVKACHEQMTRLRVLRLRAIARWLERPERGHQPELFDRRSEHERAERRLLDDRPYHAAAEQVALAESAVTVVVEQPALRLVLRSGRAESAR